MRGRRGTDRRGFLRISGAMGLAALAQGLLAGRALAEQRRRTAGYGPLLATRDETTGLKLLRLPSGFRYRTFSWRGDSLAGGGRVPSNHDGMGVVSPPGSSIVTLVRNHERPNPGEPFGNGSPRYDPTARGGTTTLRFDVVHGEWLSTEASLSGTVDNCSGGVTPWGTWLSAEESTEGSEDGFAEEHGWVFEVPADGRASARPLRGLGRFEHESACVDPRTHFVYLTEDDRFTAGFYRFRPQRVLPATSAGAQRAGVGGTELAAGGRLEMLRVTGTNALDLGPARIGQVFDVEWVPVDDPELGPQTGVGPWSSHGGQTTSCSGPFLQGVGAGGSRFRRLEGVTYDAVTDTIVFVDTDGGFPARDSGDVEGAIWRYDPRHERIEVVYASRACRVLDTPDNVATSPRNGVIVVCEDGDGPGTRISGLDARGEIFEIAQNDVVLAGEHNGIEGDYRDSEWAGVCFDPSGEWLFANIQEPGFTVAITGPWGSGPLGDAAERRRLADMPTPKETR